ncbi:hypothetical protein [Mesonia aestuariivivens]|uniref:Lipoprotein n=1 Tax=Mesonia aestuariivivens TaxID=2796128 RepID=A0ABS6W2Y5_9FLAO|nr:hypothetical protein [Mesonia aestuariivivens]MBW2962226.1 hypothetical protein [Mesonia aestuariivivens]
MNKLYLYTIIALSFITLSSCHHDDPNEDKFDSDSNSGWINFETASTQTTDKMSSISIPVEQNSETNSETTKINFLVESLEGTAPNEILGNFTATINKDELDGELIIPITKTEDSYTVQITILNSNKKNLKIGLDEEPTNKYPITHSLTVCDDTIKTETSYLGSSFVQGDLASSFEINLMNVEGESDVYKLSTAWGDNFVANVTGNDDLQGMFLYEALLYVNEDNSIIIEALDPENTGLFQGGSGSYDACTRTFTYSLNQTLFTSNFLVDVTLVTQ